MHVQITDLVKTMTCNETMTFNNAVAEVYDPTYTKMGFCARSAQSLDHWHAS